MIILRYAAFFVARYSKESASDQVLSVADSVDTKVKKYKICDHLSSCNTFYIQGTPSGGRILTRENELLRKIAKGETEYWEELIGMYYEDILRYCIYHAPDKTAAEDAVQETFLKVIRYMPDYRHRGKVQGILIQGGREHLQRPVEEMHKRRMV